MERLRKEGLGEGSLHWLKLDLLDPRVVKSSAEEFMEKEDRLDILSALCLLVLVQLVMLILNVLVNNAARRAHHLGASVYFTQLRLEVISLAP